LVQSFVLLNKLFLWKTFDCQKAKYCSW
jgi:hypothetical protein